jgi:hypothetical protein
MTQYPAIDSNVLTYFLEAFRGGYDPASDVSGLAGERVAIVRCYFYGDCEFWVSPTVKRECELIKDAQWAELHRRIPISLLADMLPEASEEDLDARAAELERCHSEHSDCRVVAEAEAMRLDVLLTCDGEMASRLGPRSTVKILRPSQFWSSLDIRAGSKPVLRPRFDHPLGNETWWPL